MCLYVAISEKMQRIRTNVKKNSRAKELVEIFSILNNYSR